MEQPSVPSTLRIWQSSSGKHLWQINMLFLSLKSLICMFFTLKKRKLIGIFLEWIPCGLYHHVWRLSSASTQSCPLRLQSILPEDICGQSWQTSNCGLEGCKMLGDAVYPRLYVQRRDISARASVNQLDQSCGKFKSSGPDLQWSVASWGQHLCVSNQPLQWIWSRSCRILSIPVSSW